MSTNRMFPGLRPAFAIGLLSATLLLGACKGGDAKAKPGDDKDKGPDAIPVEVEKVVQRSIAASYANTATLKPLQNAVVSSKSYGVIRGVLAEVGDTVRAGQPLVRLESDRPRLAAAQAEAQMRKLEANYQRAQKLVAQQMVSANDVDEIRYNLDNARAQYQAARLELSYTTITAPISGVVVNVPDAIKPGNLVQNGQDVATIVDASRLEAVLNVPEREFGKIRAGQPVTLTADALPGRKFEGTVAVVTPAVDAGSGTVRVACRFDGQGELLPGMFGRIDISYDSRADALVIPRNALLEDGGEPAVYVIRDGKAARVALKVGYSEGGWIEVREGLKAGDSVVVAGKAALREGSAVQVLGQAAARTAAAAAGKPAQQ